MDTVVDLAQLAALPDVVRALKERVDYLEARLTVAERRPYSVAEAAEALGVSPKTVRRRIARGELQHRRIGARVSVYLPPALLS